MVTSVLQRPAMSRYDGVAAWYDDTFGARGEGGNGLQLRALLAGSSGHWLDVGCGTGAFFDILSSEGRSLVGVDLSADQLARAATHPVPLARADAAALPFAAGVFDGVTATYLHTDVDDVAPVFAEAARVLRPGGRVVYLGTHPCFVGPFVERRHDGRRVIHDGYRDASWHDASPFYGPGLRSRVGARHVPLAELLNAAIDAGLCLLHVDEPGDDDNVPLALAFVAAKR